MVLITTDIIVTLAVIAVVIILVLLIILICCLCRKCDQCARWSRRKGNLQDEATLNRELTENRREFDEIRQQHDVVRDRIRVKYNLNGGNSNAAVLP